MHLKLTQVVSDITGVTGMAILKAMIAGERDPQHLAKLRNPALVILSEIGTDMHRWPSVKHFCSWLGLCPQHKISGGKVLSRRVRPGAHRVTVALRLAARSLHHSQSALGAFFRRMKTRLGTPK